MLASFPLVACTLLVLAAVFLIPAVNAAVLVFLRVSESNIGWKWLIPIAMILINALAGML
jgi:hypothetical protein